MELTGGGMEPTGVGPVKDARSSVVRPDVEMAGSSITCSTKIGLSARY